MDWDWAALGAALRARREVLRLTRAELGDRAGVHPGTIKNYELGEKAYEKIPKSVQLLESALGWAPGSAKAVLEGGEPTLLDGQPPAAVPLDDPFAQLRDRLPLRATHALENGRIFDTLTYDLTPGGGARVISVVMVDEGADTDMSPDERARIGRAWEITQRRILGLPPLAWEPGDPEEDKLPPKS